MKHLAHIFIGLTTLILLFFGAGGVGLVKCACSGKVSVMLPNDENCCRTESDCMSVRFVQLSDSEVAATLQLPVEAPQPLLLDIHSPLHCPLPAVQTFRTVASADPPPPSGVRCSMVMRV